MAMTISIDDELKRDFAAVCKDIGMSPSTAFGVFAKAVVRERRIPFDLAADPEDVRARRAYEASVGRGIREGYRQFQDGKECSREEFEQMREQAKATA